MTESWRRRQGKKRYERAGAVVLGQVRLGQAPLPLRRLRWLRAGRWSLLVLAAVTVGMALWLTVDARFYVYDAEISGARRASREEILGASQLMGLHILWARPSAVEARILEALPSLESAQVICSLPSDCSIAVVERQPRVLWNEEGKLWWIDEEGAIFPVADETTGLQAVDDVAGRWLVAGPLPRGDEGRLEERVRVALAELWASGQEIPTEFEYAGGQGLSFVESHGWRVILGDGSGMSERLRILGLMTAHLESRGVTPEYVDVRFLKAPYYAPARDS